MAGKPSIIADGVALAPLEIWATVGAEAKRRALLRSISRNALRAHRAFEVQWSGLGHIEASLDWLEHAAEERHLGYYLPTADPIYHPLRNNPDSWRSCNASKTRLHPTRKAP